MYCSYLASYHCHNLPIDEYNAILSQITVDSDEPTIFFRGRLPEGTGGFAAERGFLGIHGIQGFDAFALGFVLQKHKQDHYMGRKNDDNRTSAANFSASATMRPISFWLNRPFSFVIVMLLYLPLYTDAA